MEAMCQALSYDAGPGVGVSGALRAGQLKLQGHGFWMLLGGMYILNPRPDLKISFTRPNTTRRVIWGVLLASPRSEWRLKTWKESVGEGFGLGVEGLITLKSRISLTPRQIPAPFEASIRRTARCSRNTASSAYGFEPESGEDARGESYIKT